MTVEEVEFIADGEQWSLNDAFHLKKALYDLL